MKGLLCATAVVLLANSMALVHAALNRQGEPLADLWLTSRELSVHTPRANESGVMVSLEWQNPSFDHMRFGLTAAEAPRFDRAKLESLGFDVSKPLNAPDAVDFYRRQRPRKAFVALELDGPAFERWQAREIARIERWPDASQYRAEALEHTRTRASRLVAIDMGLEAANVRARQSNPDRIVVAPASVHLVYAPATTATDTRAAMPASLYGEISRIATDIHVQQPWSRMLESRGGDLFRMRVRWGRYVEPWVKSVER